MQIRFPFHKSFALVILVFAAALPKLASGSDSLFLQTKCQTGDLRQVTARIDVTGTLKPSNDPKVPTLPLSVKGRFVYDEMRLDDCQTPAKRRSARYYREAEAAIQIDKHSDISKLRDEMRLVGVHADQAGIAIFSPRGPFSREELELIDIPCNTLVIDRLLPEGGVKVGDSWKVADETLTSLLGLDAVSSSDVKCSLEAVKDSVAQLHFFGKLSGAVEGVTTEIDLKGSAEYQLKEKCLISIQVCIKERRSVGSVSPGLDVTAVLNVEISPLAGSDQLNADAVKEVAKGAGRHGSGVRGQGSEARGQGTGDRGESVDAAARLLVYQSEAAKIRFIYDRRWHITRDEPGLVVLRLVDRGELIAQCNISRLPKLSAGTEMTIEEFQDDIEKSLGDKLDEFVTADESTTTGGLGLMQVVAAGSVSQVPIQWHYFLVLDEQGNRVAMTFTMENDLVKRFADSDAMISESMEMTDRPAAKTASAK